MWRVVVGHEWRMVVRQAGIWLGVSALALVMAAAGRMTWHWTEMERQAHATARQDEVTRMQFWAEHIQKEEESLRAAGKPLSPTAYGPRHATNIGHYSGKRYAILPPPPLGALAVGDTDVQRSEVLVSVDSAQYAGVPDLQQPLWWRAGRFDPAFVIAMILPILLIAATSPLVAADREGVLPLLASQGAPLGRLAAVRIVVRGGPLLGCALGAIIVIGLIGRSAEGESEGALGVRLTLVVIATLAYGLFWLGLAAWLDARVRRPGTTTLALVATWLVTAVIVPALLHSVAVTWYPVASRADMEEAAREAQQEVWSGSNERILAAFFTEYPDIDAGTVGSLERFMIYQMRTVLEVDARLRPLEERYTRDRATQAGFLRAARFLSPALILQHAFEEAAGAGSQRRARFTAQLADYIAEWHNYFIPKVYYRIPIRDLSETPRFRFVEEGSADITRIVALDIGVLLLASSVCTIGARRAYRSM